MKTLSAPWCEQAVAAILLGLCLAVQAAQTPAAAPAQPAPTNAAPVKSEPPKSVFYDPANPQGGRDPFFPQSTRLKPIVRHAPSSAPPPVIELELKGISGTADRRLAIINNRTFGSGEEGEVASNAGRVRIVCADIKTDSVRVLVNGQERELHLRSKL
jgi:hypothetical protein